MFLLLLISFYVLVFLLINIALKDSHFIEKGVLALSTSLGLLSVFLYYSYLFQWDSNLTSYLLLGVIAVVLYILVRKKSVQPSKKIISSDNFTIVLFVLSPFILLSVVFSLYYPTLMQDGVIYENIATILYNTGDLKNPETMNSTHPILVSLLFFITKKAGLYSGKVIFSIYYMFFIINFYFRVCNSVKDRKICVLSTILLGTTPILWWHSFLFGNNLIPGYYFSIGVLLWFESLKRKPADYGYAVLAGIFLGFSSWCRYEFIWYSLLPILMTIFYNYGKKRSIGLLCLSAPIALINLWLPATLLILPEYYVPSKKEIIFLQVLLFLAPSFYFFDISKILRYFKERIRLFIFGAACAVYLLVSIYTGSPSQGIINMVTSGMRLVMTFVYYTGPSLLLLFLVGVKSVIFPREQKYLFFTVLGYLSIHFFIYSTGAMYNTVSRYLNMFIYHPGVFVNSSGVREMIAFFPVYIFLFAMLHDQLFGKKHKLQESHK